MNRVKKEFKKRGFLLENDYPQMPYYLKGKSCFEPGFVLIDSISVMFDEYDLGIYICKSEVLL